jgi:hypothetical protein
MDFLPSAFIEKRTLPLNSGTIRHKFYTKGSIDLFIFRLCRFVCLCFEADRWGIDCDCCQLDEQTKTLRIADHVSVKGEALFYPAHKVVNVGDVDLTAEYPFPIHYFVCCQIEVQK